MRLPRGWRRFPLVTVVLLGWLAGGLLTGVEAAFADGVNDHLYAAANLVLAASALLLLAVVGPRVGRRRRRRRRPGAERARRRGTAAGAPGRASVSVEAGATAKGPWAAPGEVRRR